MSQTKAKGFLITGEFLTRQARDLFAENAFREAERFLLTATSDKITVKQVEAVLTGKMKFVGNTHEDNIELVEDDDIEVIKHVKWLYSGILSHKRKCYRPYARVTNWGVRDLTSGIRAGRLIDDPNKSSGMFSLLKRNCAYMRDPYTDEVHAVNINGHTAVILWEVVNTVPAWLTIIESDNWQRSIDEYLEAGCLLEITGHTEKFPDAYDHKSVWSMNKSKTTQKEEETKVKVEEDNKYLRGITPLSNKELNLADNLYILPNGTAYACVYHDHNLLAEAILKLLYNTSNTTYKDNCPKSELLGLGAVSIHESAIDGSYDYHGPNRLVGKQKSTLDFWCSMHDIDTESFITRGTNR